MSGEKRNTCISKTTKPEGTSDPKGKHHWRRVVRYEPQQTGVEAKREKAGQPEVKFVPQDRTTTEYSTFSETGTLAMEIKHHNLFETEDAIRLMRLFLREKDEKIAALWPKKRLKEFIESRLKAAGQDETFLSKENLLRLQQSFGPMFRELDKEHPRMSQIANPRPNTRSS